MANVNYYWVDRKNMIKKDSVQQIRIKQWKYHIISLAVHFLHGRSTESYYTLYYVVKVQFFAYAI